jgi:hypothetical protein
MVVLGGQTLSYERGTPVLMRTSDSRRVSKAAGARKWKFPLLLKLAEVPLLLSDIPHSTFFSVGSALVKGPEGQSRSKKNKGDLRFDAGDEARVSLSLPLAL